MKILLLLLILTAAQVATSAQTVADSQRQALAKYPALAQQGSTLHTKFITLYNDAKKNSSVLFSEPNWPMLLADRAAEALAAADTEKNAFFSAQPFEGVTLDMPKGWQIRDEKTSEQVVSSVQAAAGSGDKPHSLRPRIKTYIPRARGEPANITVLFADGRSLPSQSELGSLSPSTSQKLEAQIEAKSRKVVEAMGGSLVSVSKVSVETFGDKRGIRNSIVAKLADIAVIIESNTIPLGDKEVSLVLTDIEGPSMWKAVIARARASFRVELPDVRQEEEIFRSKEYGFRLVYPPNWEHKKILNPDVVTKGEKDGAYINVIVGTPPEISGTAHDFTKADIVNMLSEQRPVPELISYDKQFIDSVPAIMTVSCTTVKTLDISVTNRMVQYLFFHGGKMFVITGGAQEKAFEEKLPTIRRVISSFKFEEGFSK